MKLDLELYRRDVVISDQPRVRLSAIDVAPEGAPRTLVFLHGFGGRSAQWRPQLNFFCDGYRVIAPDMRGHGPSDAPPTTYSLTELLGDLECALDRLNAPQQFVLLGHSFGGGLAASFAIAHPERVERLVLVATATRFRLNPFLEFVFRLPLTVLQLIRPFIPQLYAPAHVMKTMYASSVISWNGEAVLPKVAVPTLVIMGHRDLTFPREAYEGVARSVPKAQVVTIPVSAHLVQLERPDAVNRAIERFLGAAPISWREGSRQAASPTRPWVRHYEQGVPPGIVVPSQPLHRFLERAARRHPRGVATIFYDGKLKYRRLNQEANRFANALVALGVCKGDRVMLLLPNCPQSVIAYFGALKAGAVVVVSNPIFTEQELVRQVQDSGARVMVTLSRFFTMARRVQEATELNHLIVTNIKEYFPLVKRVLFSLLSERREGDRATLAGEGTHWFQVLLRNHPTTPAEVEVGPEDIATIQYTGGTTDLPKGTILTHRGLAANAVQVRYWIADAQDAREVIMAVLPFSHSYGLTTCLNAGVCLAATLVLMPTFVTKDVLEATARHHVTLFPGVPAMYVAINQYPGVRRYRLSSVRACISGAAPLPVEVQEAFEKITKGRLVEGYGLTEAGPVTHANPLGGQRRSGSIGVPVPNTEAKIVDLDTGDELPPGQVGELYVRGPQLMRGYWNLPEETARALTADGWLRTGDVARMDEDGYFQIIDRRKDMILAGPYNVYPRDVEEVLYEHPKILEAAVVGVPPEDQPQAVKAFVVLKKGERATSAEIIQFCQERLEGYALPKLVEFRFELPKTYVGKVQRRKLTETEPRTEKDSSRSPASP
jgi:long-chain acyl-CoA synthetase